METFTILFLGCFFILIFIGVVGADTTFFENSLETSFVKIDKNNVDNQSIFCGNAICDMGEDCDNCVHDCGICGDLSILENSGGSTGLSNLDIFDENTLCFYASQLQNNESVQNLGEYLLKINQNRKTEISKENFINYVENFEDLCKKHYYIIGNVILDKEDTKPKIYFGLIFVFSLIILTLVYFILKKRGRNKK